VTQQPFKIAEETFVIPSYNPVPGVGLLYMNALVIRGREPILVDTGATIHSDAYIEAAFSLVDPVDVRWIFLSHEDRDHAGSLMRVLDMCPNARLVTNAVAHGKLSEEWVIPPQRVYYANSGESFDAGDRVLTALRPPLFDSPATRGLWDPTTEVFYSSDSFGTIVAEEYELGNDVPAPDFEWGFNWFNRVNHVWHELADPAKVAALAQKVRELHPKLLISAHAPVAYHRVDELCDMIARIPTLPPQPLPTQLDLDAMLAGERQPTENAQPSAG
jgi:flavorubredoxin